MAGGGGFGDPGERDPGQVAADVLNEMVSAETAYSVYKVVLEKDGSVNKSATRKLREN
jgi:N-methylhydantoinase B